MVRGEVGTSEDLRKREVEDGREGKAENEQHD